jgi:redox-sensitive bicupin YhaK (pirin superfamily)
MWIRRSDERGLGNHGWLKSRHTFSFADYRDPRFMGFGSLRVINEDRVAPGNGFSTHSHRDMEILSYVIDGELKHKDSLGTGSVIRPGDVQLMCAGTGVSHSEFNASDEQPVHFLQIWVLPSERGLSPSYQQLSFLEQRRGKLCRVASQAGHDGALIIHQAIEVFASQLGDGEHAGHTLQSDRQAWLQVLTGTLSVLGQTLSSGDGAAITVPGELQVEAETDAHFLLFDMAKQAS